MSQDCCGGTGCNCGDSNLHTDRDCPVCGRKLRITGSLQQFRLYFTCPACGYQSERLSFDELRDVIDRV